MLRTSLAVTALALLLMTASCEPTDFDYSAHGDDWDCPQNGTF